MEKDALSNEDVRSGTVDSDKECATKIDRLGNESMIGWKARAKLQVE